MKRHNRDARQIPVWTTVFATSTHRLAIVQRDAFVYKVSRVNFVNRRSCLLVLAYQILVGSMLLVYRHQILRTIVFVPMVSREVNPAAMVSTLLLVYLVEDVFSFKEPSFRVRILLVAFCLPVKPYLLRPPPVTDAFAQIIWPAIDVNIPITVKSSPVSIREPVSLSVHRIVSCACVHLALAISIVLSVIGFFRGEEESLWLWHLDLGLVCTSAVCSNGGTCQSNGTNIQCNCPSGFAGARCEWSKIEIAF